MTLLRFSPNTPGLKFQEGLLESLIFAWSFYGTRLKCRCKVGPEAGVAGVAAGASVFGVWVCAGL